MNAELRTLAATRPEGMEARSRCYGSEAAGVSALARLDRSAPASAKRARVARRLK